MMQPKRLLGRWESERTKDTKGQAGRRKEGLLKMLWCKKKGGSNVVTFWWLAMGHISLSSQSNLVFTIPRAAITLQSVDKEHFNSLNQVVGHYFSAYPLSSATGRDKEGSS